jgi:hypothetical protein
MPGKTGAEPGPPSSNPVNKKEAGTSKGAFFTRDPMKSVAGSGSGSQGNRHENAVVLNETLHRKGGIIR